MSIELQKIDCNCNDCVFMVRDIPKFKKSLETHKKWALDHFEAKKQKLINKSLEYRRRNDLEKYNQLSTMAGKMKFQFNKKEVSTNFGYCSKLKKEVRFIPNICMIENQECFKHRNEE